MLLACAFSLPGMAQGICPQRNQRWCDCALTPLRFGSVLSGRALNTYWEFSENGWMVGWYAVAPRWR
ncbi:hypothetical protein BPSOL_0761 [Bifidobacterium pseudolongum]|nr:hypothetical protein BPSOL_0761 [Bifidobacterium pseudolongum]